MKKFLIASAVFFAACLAFSQSAEKISEILDSERITYSQAAYLSLSAKGASAAEESVEKLKKSGAISTGAGSSEKINMQDFAWVFSISEEAAFDQLKNSGAIKDGISANDEISIQEFAWICASTWDINGSLFLKLFNNSRYTFRQMRADGVIPSGADPRAKLSGHEALNIISECSEAYEIKKGETK